MTFENWMDKVNAIVESKYGVSTDDLPDLCYVDMWEDDYTPAQAAKSAIQGGEW